MAVHLLRDLERMADLGTHLAEGVVFLVDGGVVRHPGTAPVETS